MNGVRSTFMRRGYLLTALSALLLLAASAGTAEAQRVSIGFVETSGTFRKIPNWSPTTCWSPRESRCRFRDLTEAYLPI